MQMIQIYAEPQESIVLMKGWADVAQANIAFMILLVMIMNHQVVIISVARISSLQHFAVNPVPVVLTENVPTGNNVITSTPVKK